MQGTINRLVTVRECPWLTSPLFEGETVYKYNDHTYGVIKSGVAVTAEDGKTPFFEVPIDAVDWEEEEEQQAPTISRPKPTLNDLLDERDDFPPLAPLANDPAPEQQQQFEGFQGGDTGGGGAVGSWGDQQQDSQDDDNTSTDATGNDYSSNDDSSSSSDSSSDSGGGGGDN